MGAFRWILGLHLQRPFRFFYVLLVSVIEVFLYLYPVSVTADIVSAALDGTLTNLGRTLFYLLLFAFFQASVFFSLNFLNETLAHRVTTDMTEQLFVSVQRKSLRYHDSKDVGQIMARASGDTRTINSALSPGIVRSIQLFTIWGLATYISIVVYPLLLILTLSSFALYLVSLYIYGKNRIEISRTVLENFSDLTEYSLQSVSGMREIKNFTAEEMTGETFARINDSHIKAVTKEGERNAFFYPALVATLYSALMIAISVYMTFISLISFRDLILITGVILFLRAFSSNLQWQSRVIIAAIAGTRRVYNLITEPDFQDFTDGDVDISGTPASITFDNVSFRYDDHLPNVLKNISFTIEDNQTIAIVGRPGSGKSTLTKLLQRLYLPTEGEIRIGDRTIQDYSMSSMRHFLATVEQDIFLFNRSIRDNIRFAKPEASREEIVEIAKIAHAHEYITSFPDGYDTIIGERGVRLSGGQAQRLSIARALMVDPAILLMDDGASALDAKTELEIQNAIADILRTRTTVITTHRLSIIAKADLVLILDQGQLVGKGTHKELITTNPYYRRIFESHYELPPLEEISHD
ncbi:MAG: ABC transporter ATP-binding protein [Candidatus Kariarchaeaceae archaeon]|jgi:ABC-type multidrug transport system fused ATPase/permease subunit